GRARAQALTELFRKGAPEKVQEWIAAGRPDTPVRYQRHDAPRVLVEALEVVARVHGCALLAETVERNAAARAVLERYADVDRALRAETGTYRFEDFPLALLRGPARTDPGTWLEELAYRLDGRIDHLLLDEFQDTAPMQWSLVEPLADEILSGGTEPRTFFCVGDLKQSIYGWRNGEPRLLGGLARRYPVLEEQPMTESYRSSRVVLDAVNRVFESLPASAALDDPGRAAARCATDEWIRGFEPHSAVKEREGEARVWRARPAVGDEKPADPILELAVERVATYRERVPDATIAVLVRARSNIPRLRFLLERAGIESSDDGGNPLTDSMAVTWVLALLQLADHPGDGVAALQVARAGWADALALDRSALLSRDSRRAEPARVARAVRRAVAGQGFGGFCEARASELAPRFGDWDRRRLEQLVEFALAYDESAGPRPIDFVSRVREERVPDPTASRVKVMTIHASKGLEFDVVVLPELFKQIRL
ncbi:MAG: UvrD-helicase domain-containing protein, partial [Planctomycetota bacterium]